MKKFIVLTMMMVMAVVAVLSSGCSMINSWFDSDYEVEGKTTVAMGITSESFFSLVIGGDNTLYAGTYSQPKSSSPKIYKYGVSNYIVALPGGESVYAMYPVDSTHLIASCENKGKVYLVNTSDGSYSEILDLASGSEGGAFGIGKALSNLYIVGGGEIYKYGSGTVLKFSSDYYVKEIFEFNGKVYAPGYKKSTNCGGWFVSSDGNTFAWVDILSKARFMYGAVSPDGDNAVLVGTCNYSGGSHHNNSASVFKMTGSTATLIQTFSGFDFIESAAYANEEQVILGLTKGWKSSSAGAQIVSLKGSAATALYTTSEAEIWDIVLGNECVYVATRTHGVGGKVYKVE